MLMIGRNCTEFLIYQSAPEDAIIGRALLSGDEVLDLVKLGMNYSKMGYDEIEYDYLECPEDVELDGFIQDYLDNANNGKYNKN